MKPSSTLFALILLLSVGVVSSAACKKKPPIVSPPPTTAATPSAFPNAGGGNPPPPGPVPAAPPRAVSDAPITSNPLLPWDAQPLDVINGPDSPLKPVFFAYDSDAIDEEAKKVLTANAEVLKTYRTWVITIEGHCDERGTAEYNLALGDRRALAAKTYLVSLGIASDRIRTVSYGNEFPFDPAHTDAAWAKNRRAHVMLTSK